MRIFALHGPQRTALGALGVTIALALAKVGVWAATGSLAVLSQALDSALDVVALSLVFFGVRVAARPADAEHHYGHGKAENLVAFGQTLLLGAVALVVALEAVGDLTGDPGDIEAPWYAFALLATSAVVDAARVRTLSRVARKERSDALRAAALNIASDIGTAVIALASLAATRAGLDRADAVGSLVVVAIVGVAAVRLGNRSVDVLMDRAPRARVDAIEAAAGAAPGVAETRRVRVRRSGKQLFADVTVAAGGTASLERAHDIAEGVEKAIDEVAPGADVVVHVEPLAETSGLVERVQAAAGRTEGVHEVHNVLVHAFDEGGRRKLHVTLHAKTQPGTSVAAAHDLSDRIEKSVVEELGPSARVDTHIEPLETTSVGKDVTHSRGDIVSAVHALALREPEILDCHEVLVTHAVGTLSVVAHVRGRKDLPLAMIHSASERVEKELIARHPEVASVLIHFEPA